MKIRLGALRRLIREESSRLAEATREFYNMRSDALTKAVGESIELQLHGHDGVKNATLTCTGEDDGALYDSDEPVKLFELTVEDFDDVDFDDYEGDGDPPEGNMISVAEGTIDDIIEWFQDTGNQFSY
jgi:hypothetical protein